MKATDKINSWLHPFMAMRVRSKYRKEIRNWERKHPSAFARISPSVREKHFSLWGRLISSPCDNWLRLLTFLSGKSDYRFMPADVYYSSIERCLNDCDSAGNGIEDKNKVALYVPNEFMPSTLVRFVRGMFFDANFKPIAAEDADEILRGYAGDIIGKQSVGSCGGKSVRLFTDVGNGVKKDGGLQLSAKWIASHNDTYIAQERVRQEPVIASFNPQTVNTCRIVTFRRPWSGVVSVIASMIRFGGDEKVVDNISSGGFCASIDDEGVMSSNGVDGAFNLISEHPISHIKTKGISIPGFKEMCDVAITVASRVPEYNLLGFDMVVREDGRPCVIEVNATSIACVHVQMNRPFFGDETEEVVDWCLAHRDYDRFNHFRTWY